MIKSAIKSLSVGMTQSQFRLEVSGWSYIFLNYFLCHWTPFIHIGEQSSLAKLMKLLMMKILVIWAFNPSCKASTSQCHQHHISLWQKDLQFTEELKSLTLQLDLAVVQFIVGPKRMVTERLFFPYFHMCAG